MVSYRSFSICDPTDVWWGDISIYAALTLFGIQFLLSGVTKTPYMPGYIRWIGFLHATLYWFLGALLQEIIRAERPLAALCTGNGGIWNRSLNIWGFPDILYVSPASMALALLAIDAFICNKLWQLSSSSSSSWWRHSGYAGERVLDWIFWLLISVAYWCVEFLLQRTTVGLAILNWIATLALAALSFGLWYGVQRNLQNVAWMEHHLSHFYHPHNTRIEGICVERTVRTRPRTESVANVVYDLFPK